MRWCVHVIEVEGIDSFECGRPGEGVVLPTPGDRRPAVGGPYCPVHGGVERARRVAEADWAYAAPASVGGMYEVERAGSWSLMTEHAYVVLRRHESVWLAWVGLGSHLIEVENPGARVRFTSHGNVRMARSRLRPRGACSFRERDAALDAAVGAWRAKVAARVAEIKEARGGTLAWGLPVEPLTAPIVIEAAPGECASDLAVRALRVAHPGMAWISGVRPSGEMA